MADMKFIGNLKSRDPDLFTGRQAVQLKIHLKKLEEKLDPNHLYNHVDRSTRHSQLVTLMTSVSRVGGGLLKFIHAIDNYMDRYYEMKPKKDRLVSIQHDYESNLLELTRLESSIEKSSQTLTEYRQRFDTAMDDKCQFQEQTDVAQRRCQAAETLLVGFRSETTRWTNELKYIKQSSDDLIGNCLLASAFLVYCSPFTYDIRQELIDKHWTRNLHEKKIALTGNFRIEHFLSSTIEIAQWISQGLPSDEFSIQNGLLTVKSNRCPFLIDPQLQGLVWIEQREKTGNLKILSMYDKDIVKHLELAMKYG
jgi:dynein heavy chain, axonemal